ncbi:MAG TPA: DUF2218 domain-containing protein [Stellaceae bacterium]|nr:DUF2218 domain-containing protein [Stellaceae bacterium]
MDPVLTAEARVATALAQRYMTQLCKHFEHRLPAQCGAAEGSVEFPYGVCRMAVPEPALLVLRAEAGDEAALARLEHTVVRHLERFAFRDKPAIVWRRAAG